MAAITWDVHTASEEFLITLCQQAEKESGLIGGYTGGDQVVKLSNEIAVRFGYGVAASEARTQEFARQNTNSNIVHVPQVYRFFQRDETLWHSPKGYLFMEYVQGQSLKELNLDIRSDIIPRVAQIVAHLGQIQGSQVPGPIGSGQPEGYLWGDNGARTTFNCVSDLEAWLNKRLTLQNKTIDLSDHPLVLCHLDLCRRNMILEKNDTICLVDWGSAGLYPRFFEISSLSCLNPYDEPYEKPLLQATKALLGLTEEEKRLMVLLQIARALSLRYIFETGRNTFCLPDDFTSLPPPPPLLDR